MPTPTASSNAGLLRSIRWRKASRPNPRRPRLKPPLQNKTTEDLLESSFPCEKKGGLPNQAYVRPVAYQLIFNANWNCRGSSDAVGSPARQEASGLQSGLTSAILFRLKRLNISVMNSRFTLSVK